MWSAVLLLAGLVSLARGAGNWNYNLQDPRGPLHWEHECNEGSRQSPINIPRSGVELREFPALVLTNYDLAPESMEMYNNGHTIRVTPKPYKEGQEARLSGGGLNREYKLAQLHFHWGMEDERGSEHLRSSSSFPMEMHLVHYDARFETIEDALASEDEGPDTLAALAVLFSMQSIDNPDLDRLLAGLNKATYYENSTQLKTFPIEHLLPGDLSSFYRYNGSLTTPGCEEIVTWTVLKKPVSISLEQLVKFRYIRDKNGVDIMGDNFRPPQPLNGRPIFDVTTYSNDDMLHLSSSHELTQEPRSSSTVARFANDGVVVGLLLLCLPGMQLL